MTTYGGTAPDTETITQTVAAAGEQVAELIPVVTAEGQAPVDPAGVSEVVADEGYHSNQVLPELELSNNLAENVIRPVAWGRKNWLHLGSAEAGPRIAAILAVVETRRRLGIDLRAYLMDVLPRLADTSIQKVPERTPTGWVGQRR